MAQSQNRLKIMQYPEKKATTPHKFHSIILAELPIHIIFKFSSNIYFTCCSHPGLQHLMSSLKVTSQQQTLQPFERM